MKKDKTVKTALYSRKLNEKTVKRKALMHNMEDLISWISRQIADEATDKSWISKFVLDFAYGQLQLSKHATDICIFSLTGGNLTGYFETILKKQDFERIL